MRKRQLIIHLLLTVLVLCFFIQSSSADLIPADRLATWQGNVGVEGGIPNRTVICTTLSPGVTAAQINTALQNCAAGGVVLLNPGNYSLSGSILMRSQRTLRGAGMQATVLSFTSSGSLVSFDGGYTDNSGGGVGIVTGYVKDSSQLQVSSVSGLSNGSFVYISELNDPDIPVDPDGAEGDCTGFGACGMYPSIVTRLRFQLSKVTSVNGNNITISPSMLFNFSGSRAPQINRVTATMVQYAGLESLTVRNSVASAKNIRLQGTANSWVRDVKVDNCGVRCLELWIDVYRNEIRENVFTRCIDRGGSDRCYAVHLWSGTGNLIENNIFNSTANGVVVVSSSGNVIAYNYLYGVHRTDDTSWFWPDAWTHGAHTSYNLWEGNDQNALEWDLYWGSNSHNTAFRNRFHGRDASIPNSADTTIGALLTYPNNNYMTNIGNVLGEANYHDRYEARTYSSSGRPIWLTVSSVWGINGSKAFSTMLRHRNYDYFTNSVKNCNGAGEPGCQGSDGSTTLPNSLYLPSKPSWFGSVAWPPIGPDVAGLSNKLPAQLRFEGNYSYLNANLSTLSVSVSGTGSGSVTSNPAGINCGNICSATLDKTSVLTLNAVAIANSTFTGWSGACSGTSSCVVNMNSDKTVSATFTFTRPAHPADRDSDFNVTASEFTTYNNNYKQTLSWIGGAPPSSSSFSRALLLFKLGQRYNYDSSKTCPLCWINGS